MVTVVPKPAERVFTRLRMLRPVAPPATLGMPEPPIVTGISWASMAFLLMVALTRTVWAVSPEKPLNTRFPRL
jgi:hypothetical protein